MLMPQFRPFPLISLCFLHQPAMAIPMALQQLQPNKRWEMKPTDSEEISAPLGLIYHQPISPENGASLCLKESQAEATKAHMALGICM